MQNVALGINVLHPIFQTLVHIDPDRSEIESIFKAGPTSKCRSVLAYDFT